MANVRPSPSDSATAFSVGTFRRGNDGNWWQVKSYNGVQKWVKAQSGKYININPFNSSTINLQISKISIDPNAKQTYKFKQNNMAKVKSITKKTTQEVRTIETSLINKEEVFKMLALAESTGLPLLLVGQPGVNSK